MSHVLTLTDIRLTFGEISHSNEPQKNLEKTSSYLENFRAELK